MNIRHTSRYKKGAKRVAKRGKQQINLLQVVQAILSNALNESHKDHALKGNWAGHRECHIEGDWILVYRWEENLLILVDTGSHADVFGM